MKALVKARAEPGLWLEDVPEPVIGISDDLIRVRSGVYTVSFSFPVVPRGQARIRAQMSAAHTRADLEYAADTFAAAREPLGD